MLEQIPHSRLGLLAQAGSGLNVPEMGKRVFFCAFALAKLAKMEAQHRQTLKNSRNLIAR